MAHRNEYIVSSEDSAREWNVSSVVYLTLLRVLHEIFELDVQPFAWLLVLIASGMTVERHAHTDPRRDADVDFMLVILLLSFLTWQ